MAPQRRKNFLSEFLCKLTSHYHINFKNLMIGEQLNILNKQERFISIDRTGIFPHRSKETPTQQATKID